MHDPKRQVRIANNIGDYSGFLRPKWESDFESIVSSAKELAEISLDLVLEWRSAANTASMPTAILEHVQAYHDGFINTGDLNTVLMRLASAIPAKLAQEVPAICSDPQLVRKLQEKIVQIGAEIEEARDTAKDDFPLNEMWQSYINEEQYRITLWGSQRICFVAIYNAYENFVTRVVNIAHGQRQLRSSSKMFASEFQNTFGTKLYARCWTEKKIKKYRLVRHALSHTGGAETSDLKGMLHGIEVVDGRLQITAHHTKELLFDLQDCAKLLAESAAKLQQFA